jgi:hypothetical protein
MYPVAHPIPFYQPVEPASDAVVLDISVDIQFSKTAACS